MVGPDPFRLWNLRHVLKHPAGQSLADIRPSLFEPKCFVHVADEHFDMVAPFFTSGLDVVLEYVLPYSISVLGRSRRVASQEPPVLT